MSNEEKFSIEVYKEEVTSRKTRRLRNVEEGNRKRSWESEKIDKRRRDQLMKEEFVQRSVIK